MREDLVVPGEGEENFVLARDAKVVTLPFTPLEQRMQKEKPQVYAKLQLLREEIGDDTFKRLVSKIHNINYAAGRVLIVPRASCTAPISKENCCRRSKKLSKPISSAWPSNRKFIVDKAGHLPYNTLCIASVAVSISGRGAVW